MKFEKVSLEQFTRDYMATKGRGKVPSPELAAEIEEIWERIKLPERSTKGSAGYDFFLPYGIYFSSLDETLFPTGIRFECDEDKFLMCVPRSGLGFKYGAALQNTMGIIDSDYHYSDNEGHIMCKMVCRDSFELDQGKAFMQGIILPYYKVDDDNAEGTRNGGFGSTGR